MTASKGAEKKRKPAPARARTHASGQRTTRDQALDADRSPSSGLRRQLVEQEILERAAELFAERGFAGTTVQDIAEALGMSRPALYYYVKSKDVLLERLVENLSMASANEVEAIRTRRSGEPLEKLAEMARFLAFSAASNPHQAQILTQNKHHLPRHIAQMNDQAERTVVRALMWTLEQGAKRGQVRPLDPRTSALAIIGMCLWTAWWAADQPVDVIAGRVADQAVAGVLAAGGHQELSTPADLLRSARADLDRLQATLEA